MKELTIYRKRLIPNECILLKDDVILHQSADQIVTSWQTLNPRKDFDHGYSLYLPEEGIKISKFYRADNSLLYWYCDIVDYVFDEESATLTTIDLLADVIIMPDGFVKVLDLDELADALSLGLIDDDTLQRALTRLNTLLNCIYRDEFIAYKKTIEAYE